MRRDRRFGPRLYEIVALLNAAAVIVAINRVARFRLNVGASFRALVPFVLMAGVTVFLAAGIRTLAIAARRGRRSARLFLGLFFRPASLLELLRLLVATAVVSYGYSWLKVFLPRLNSHLADQALYAADNAIHFGVNPNRFVLALFPLPALWRFIDVAYASFVFTLFAGLAWFLSEMSLPERRRFASGFAFLWLVGSWWYLATPSLGPCYVFREDYARVKAHIPMQANAQEILFRQYGAVRKGLPGEIGLNPAFGIAAMPSLHVAGQAFLALWLRRRHPRAALVAWLVTALTFFGSLVTGWHYAVDGYAGALLAWLAYRWGIFEKRRPA